MRSTAGTTNPVKKHRQEVWLRIIAPVLLPFIALILLGVVLAIGVATGSLVRDQIAVIMGCLGTLFITIPLVVVCLIPYAILAFSAIGAGKLYANFQTPLRFVRRLTERTSEKTKQIAPKVAQPFIGLSTFTTRIEHTVRGWTNALPTGRDSSED